MMKRMTAIVLALVLALTMAACGGKDQEAPDLTAYYDEFMASLGEENAPAMMDITDETLDAFYPGLSGYALKQSVVKGAAIGAVAFEFALVECESEDDVEAVKGILQSRIDSQVNGGAFYPAATEAWQNAELITNGSVVALIVAGDSQADAVTAFNALFK